MYLPTGAIEALPTCVQGILHSAGAPTQSGTASNSPRKIEALRWSARALLCIEFRVKMIRSYPSRPHEARY